MVTALGCRVKYMLVFQPTPTPGDADTQVQISGKTNPL